MKNFRTLGSVFAFSLAVGLLPAGSALADTEVYGANGTNGVASSPSGTDGGPAVIDLSAYETYMYAQGGNGGDAYASPSGAAANGGQGGFAAATDTFSSLGDRTVSADAIGGNGGYGYGLGGFAGSGMSALTALNVTSLNGGRLNLAIGQVGGDGGDGLGGAQGGNGASSVLTNGVTGSTTGGLYLRQILAAGDAGDGSGVGGSAGAAGSAISTMDVNDTTANYLSVESTATGGQGGSVSSGALGATRGGDGVSSVSLVSAAQAQGRSIATGGAGGSVNTGSTGSGGAGGDGISSLVATAYEKATTHQQANGGVGGQGQNDDGGQGGKAVITTDVTVLSPLAASTSSFASTAYLWATGGKGGNTYGDGNKAGKGGLAEIGGTFVMDGTSEQSLIKVTAGQTGGSGGNGYSGADGGEGADSSLTDVFSFDTEGKVTLAQTARGGAGGSSDTGTAGAAGNAVSTLLMNGSSSVNLALTSTAYGGAGGASTYGISTNGGNAFSSLTAGSTKTGAKIVLLSNAYGGVGSNGSLRGNAVATADATGIGGGTLVRSISAAQGTTSTAKASSTITDAYNNKLVTSVLSEGSDVKIYAKSMAVASAANYSNEPIGPGYGVSTANITRSATTPQTSTVLGTATGEFVEIGDGKMGAVHSSGGTGGETYTMSASFTFDSLEAGNALVFSVTDDTVYGTGFSSAAFSLSQDGVSLYSGTYASVADWQAAMATSINLEGISGTTMITISMAQIITNQSAGYVFDYVLAVADMDTLGGTYQTVSGVPLPAAAPLFAASLFGLGAWGRRRSKKNTA